MDGNKTVESGHTIVTENSGENKTALDSLLENNGPYQPDMAPLAVQPNTNVSGTVPDGAVGGIASAASNAPVANIPATEPGTEGNGDGDSDNEPPADNNAKNMYADMEPSDLRKLCKERGLKSAANIRPEVLIASLLEYDVKMAGDVDDSTGDDEAKTEVLSIVLRTGATYRFRGKSYENGIPTPEDPDIAARLLRTGMFVKE